MRTFYKKIRSNRGETLTETLSSLLIIVPAMVMLAGAIVAAARINMEARSSNVANIPEFTYANGNGIAITGGELFSNTNVTWYKENDSVYYYFR